MENEKENVLKEWDQSIADDIYCNCIDIYKEYLVKIANTILIFPISKKEKIKKWEKESEKWHLNYSKKYFKDNFEDLKIQTKNMLEYAIENKLNIDVIIGSYDNNSNEELSDECLETRIDNNVAYETDRCFDEICEEIDFEYLVKNDIKEYVPEE